MYTSTYTYLQLYTHRMVCLVVALLLPMSVRSPIHLNRRFSFAVEVCTTVMVDIVARAFKKSTATHGAIITPAVMLLMHARQQRNHRSDDDNVCDAAYCTSAY